MWKCQLTMYWQQYTITYRWISERLLSLRSDPATWTEYSVWRNCHAIICFASSMLLLVTCSVQSSLFQTEFHLGRTFRVVERGNTNINEMKWYKIEIISIMWSDILLLCCSSHWISIKIKFIVWFSVLFIFLLHFFRSSFFGYSMSIVHTNSLNTEYYQPFQFEFYQFTFHIHFCWVDCSILRPFIAFFILRLIK